VLATEVVPESTVTLKVKVADLLAAIVGVHVTTFEDSEHAAPVSVQLNTPVRFVPDGAVSVMLTEPDPEPLLVAVMMYSIDWTPLETVRPMADLTTVKEAQLSSPSLSGPVPS